MGLGNDPSFETCKAENNSMHLNSQHLRYVQLLDMNFQRFQTFWLPLIIQFTSILTLTLRVHNQSLRVYSHLAGIDHAQVKNLRQEYFHSFCVKSYESELKEIMTNGIPK